MTEQRWIAALLSPCNAVYGGIMQLRARAYASGWFRSERVPQCVISVGNLTVGGTGKTPVTEYLARHLSPTMPTAILSRGYGRKTRGFILAAPGVTASEVGDEPLQYFQKFSPEIPVAVCESRVAGARKLHELFPERNLILLDDAYQHLAIRRDVNLLLNDFNRPFYKDAPFPGGRLREGRQAARRATTVIVTKCPDKISLQEKKNVAEKTGRYTAPGTPVFFSHIAYGKPLNFAHAPVSLKKVKMVTGIANPAPLAAYLDTRFDVEDKMVFADHYNYTATDLEAIVHNLKKGTFAVTTEKDMVKLKPLAEEMGVADRFAYIPVTVSFGEDTGRFNEWILNQIKGRD